MKNRLIIIAQKVDQNDDHRGFFIDWIKEFARHFKEVSVISLAVGDYDLPDNVRVYSLGKERGDSKLIQAFRFYKYLFSTLPDSDGVLAHASPIFVLAAWPAAILYGKKIILWYLHRSVTFKLKLAEKLSYKIVTANKESLGIKSDKIIETGHGINTEMFRTNRSWESKDRINILTVGRITPIKNLGTLIQVAAILKGKGIKFDLKIVGQPVMPADYEYQNKLKEMIKESDLSEQIKFVGLVPYSKLPEYYKEADIFVNMTPKGGIDKALLEAMTSGCMVMTSNEVSRKYLGSNADDLIFDYNNPEVLAEKIIFLIQSPEAQKGDISNFLMSSVIKNHSLKNTIEHISSLL